MFILLFKALNLVSTMIISLIIVHFYQCLNAAAKFLEKSGGSAHQVVGIGITNQRETTIAWDKTTGKPLYNAIVWHDNRTNEIVSRLKKKELEVKDKKDALKKRSGLPLSTYFSAVKV